MAEDKGKEVEEDQGSEEESRKTDEVQEVRRFDPEATAQDTNTDRDDGDDAIYVDDMYGPMRSRRQRRPTNF